MTIVWKKGVMAEKKTCCYSYFSIFSRGEVQNGIGFIAESNSNFDPANITKRLDIEPHGTMKKGDERRTSIGVYGTYAGSSWDACQQEEPSMDAEAQCLAIVRALREKVPILQQIKKEINVDFLIVIVPEVYGEEVPLMHFNQEIISFCHATGTEISIDMYVVREPLWKRVF